MTREEREFCEDNSISIEKFLNDNFIMMNQSVKKNKKNRRWRIKHSEIMVLDNIIKVPIPFAIRYKELISIGKLIIVRDDFGFFQCYINPRIIVESYALGGLEKRLHDLIEDINELDLENVKIRRTLSKRIADLQENIRIINHFNGSETLQNTYNLIESQEKIVLKRVDKKINL